MGCYQSVEQESKMNTKEDLYDKEVYPLMKRIIDICKSNNIPMFAVFQCADDEFCSSMRYRVDDAHRVFKFFDAIHQSIEGDSVNIDKFMFWVMKEAKKSGHCSIVLNQLGVSQEAE
jgi:hypothetical protein